MRSWTFSELLSASRSRRTAPQQSHAPRFSPRGALRSRHFFHGLLESPRSLRVLLTLLAAVPLLGAVSPGQQAPAPPPDPVESGAWLKIFGIISGAPDPVVLSEAEVNALLASAQLTAIFTERAGLTGVQARLLPDEVHLRGRMEVSRLAAALGPGLGPLAPPAGSPPQPIELVLRLRDIGGSAAATVVRGTISGMELPPLVIAEAVSEAFSGALTAQFPDGSRPSLDGTPFPLPQRIDRFEVRSGEILLQPATP